MRKTLSKEAEIHSTRRAIYTATTITIITLPSSTCPQTELFLHPNNHSLLLHKTSNNIHLEHSNRWGLEAQIKLISNSFNRETYLLKNRLKVQQIQWLSKQTVRWLNLSDLLSIPKVADLQVRLAHSFLNQWNISKLVGAKLELVRCNNRNLTIILLHLRDLLLWMLGIMKKVSLWQDKYYIEISIKSKTSEDQVMFILLKFQEMIKKFSFCFSPTLRRLISINLVKWQKSKPQN